MSNVGTRLTISELPEEWKLWCQDKRPDLISRDVFEEFVDYWKARPGQGGTKLDWFATWRNWVRRTAAKKPVFAPEAPKRVYPQSKPLPERRPDSAAYREFRERMAKLKDPAHPRVVGFLRVGEAIYTVDEAQREWQEERIAMQQQDK